MSAIPNALKAVSLFVMPPRECGRKGGLRGGLDRLRMHYDDLRQEVKGRFRSEMRWLFARWVRRWRLRKGEYVAGSWCAPNTVWELANALKGLDPHAEILLGDSGARCGFSKLLVAPDAPNESGAVALMPARFP